MKSERTELKIYDVVVTEKTEAAVTFQDPAGKRYRFKENHGFLSLGDVGCLTLTKPRKEAPFTFARYPDPRIRRVPDLDDVDAGQWAWRCLSDEGEQLVRYVKPDLVPGKAGQVIKDTTTPVVVNVPMEFLELAATRGLSPEQVLRGFIADLCELQNYFVLPREDGLSSNGSDERLLAREYFERAHGMY